MDLKKYVVLTPLGPYHVYAESKRKAIRLIPRGIAVLKAWAADDKIYALRSTETPVDVLWHGRESN